jgi:hypothetical protein
MSVIPLTVFFSLLLAGTFVVLFLREQGRRHLTSPERDSLLPLADETPVSGESCAPRQMHLRGLSPGAMAKNDEQAPEDDHDHDSCGCRDGARPPCAHCLRRRDEQEPAYF